MLNKDSMMMRDAERNNFVNVIVELQYKKSGRVLIVCGHKWHIQEHNFAPGETKKGEK